MSPTAWRRTITTPEVDFQPGVGGARAPVIWYEETTAAVRVQYPPKDYEFTPDTLPDDLPLIELQAGEYYPIDSESFRGPLGAYEANEEESE